MGDLGAIRDGEDGETEDCTFMYVLVNDRITNLVSALLTNH